MSAAVGDGLFATAPLPLFYVLGEYGGVLRSEAIAVGLGSEDMYRVSYPALEAGTGSALYVSARHVGGWMRLVNHAKSEGRAEEEARRDADAGEAFSHVDDAHSGACAGVGGESTGGAASHGDPASWRANCAFRVAHAAGVPRIIVVTTRAIREGEQLLVDYGAEAERAFQGKRGALMDREART